MRDCIARQVKCAIVITSGFSKTGPECSRLEKEIRELAIKDGLPLAGPNCAGNEAFLQMATWNT